jgi:nitroreductase
MILICVDLRKSASQQKMEENMELVEAIKGRRSVRKFKSQEVPREKLEKILELAMWAPSGMNRQEWIFVIVRGQKREDLLKIFGSAFETFRPNLEKVFPGKSKMIEAIGHFFQTYGGAPVFILAYAGKSASGQWDTHSTAVALQNLFLAAYAEGLGTVWSDGILVKEPEINALMGIEGMKLVAVVPVGYPDEISRVPPRREGRVQWVGF